LLTATGASGRPAASPDEVESHAPESDEFVIVPLEFIVAPAESVVKAARPHNTSCPPTVCVTLRGTAISSAAPTKIDQDELKQDKRLNVCLNCAATFLRSRMERVASRISFNCLLGVK
jgi:hypothetical protein